MPAISARAAAIFTATGRHHPLASNKLLSPFVRSASVGFSWWQCPSVCLSVAWNVYTKTRFSQKLSNLELWSLLATYRKSYMDFSKNYWTPKMILSDSKASVRREMYAIGGACLWHPYMRHSCTAWWQRQVFVDNLLRVVTWSGCLQLLEILEISWNLIAPPGNFCVIDRWSIVLSYGPVIGKLASTV